LSVAGSTSGFFKVWDPTWTSPAVLESFRTKYPQVEFAVRSLNTGEIPGLVRSGYVDLSFHAMISNKSGFLAKPFILLASPTGFEPVLSP
jgi:DNA-binding transcriptional LysR family regulator